MASQSTSTPAAVVQATPIPAVPLAHDLQISKDAEDWLKTLSPQWFQTHDEIQRLWNTPTSQFTLTLLGDPEFKTASEQILNAQAGPRLVGYEFVLIIFLWIVRPWRLSKASSGLQKLWTQAWLAIVFWLLALIAVPALVWGEPYLTVLKQVFKAFLRHFIT